MKITGMVFNFSTVRYSYKLCNSVNVMSKNECDWMQYHCKNYYWTTLEELYWNSRAKRTKNTTQNDYIYLKNNETSRLIVSSKKANAKKMIIDRLFGNKIEK